MRHKIEELLAQREALYESYSSLVLDGGEAKDKLVEMILHAWNKDSRDQRA